MKQAAILGVDFGLSKVHSTIININTGELFEEREVDYTWDYQANNCSEIRPEKIWEAAQSVVEGVLKQYDPATIELRAVVFSCFGESVVPIDTEGNALYPLIGASDTRATTEAAQLAEGIPNYSQIAGGNVAASSVSSKILWLRNHQPEVFEKAARFCSIQEYIISRVGIAGCNDYTLAARKMMVDVQQGDWSKEICGFIGVRPEQLGDIVSSSTCLGEIETFGRVKLPRKLKVIVGAHDACSSAIGLGISPFNKELLIGNNSGTWNLMNMYFDRFVDAAEKAPGLTPGSGPIKGSYYFQVAGSVGPLLEWFINTFCGGQTLAALSKRAVYDATCNVRLIRDPMTGNGCFIGLSFNDTASDVLTGIIESLTFPMKGMLRQYENLSGKSFKTMRISAGGAKADNWVQLKANVMNIRMERVANLQASSVGAVINAGIGLGEFNNYDQAIKELVRVERVFEPQPELVERYAERMEEFKAYDLKGSCFFI